MQAFFQIQLYKKRLWVTLRFNNLNMNDKFKKFQEGFKNSTGLTGIKKSLSTFASEDEEEEKKRKAKQAALIKIASINK